MTNYDKFIRHSWAIAGVYSFGCGLTKNLYIGESQNIGLRIHGHVSELLRGSHSAKLLQEEVVRFGIKSFWFDLLQEESDYDLRIARETKLQLENQEYLYSKYINGEVNVTYPKLTAEQIRRVKGLRMKGVVWEQVAKMCNKAFGYSYSFGWYVKSLNDLGINPSWKDISESLYG